MKRAAGPFEILEVLGEGSFGTVCVARIIGDPARRTVALKILKGAYTRNQKILNRTRDEARLLSRISHPNVVRVERLMDIGGRPVVVMEHVRGVSLDQLLSRHRDGLPTSIALDLVRDTCMALHVAFNEAVGDDGRALRVIHRDIKPSNVLISVEGEVKVVDFGIAKGDFEGREAETQSVVMGSRPYMAPERLDGISDSPAVDVYSSGMSLFELLTGRTMSLSINPVTHDQAMNRQLMFLQAPGLPPAGLEELRALIRKMCAYDREQRPSAMDSARALDRLSEMVEPARRTSLAEFAVETVIPLYDARPKLAPEDAKTSSDDDFLFDVGSGRAGGAAGARRAPFRFTPQHFLLGLLALVLVLALAAAVKVLRSDGADSGVVDVAAAVEEQPPPAGTVRVRLWFPADAQAQVGAVRLLTPGTVFAALGKNLLELNFVDGRQVSCSFEARDGVAVRYTGPDGISVDDGPAQACTELATARIP